MPKALIVDDDSNDRSALADTLGTLGFQPTAVGSLADARSALEANGAFELVLLDVRLPDGEGFELLPMLEAKGAGEVVFVTAYASIDSAVTALRGGADDYLTKPIEPKRLQRLAASVLRNAELRGEVRELRSELRSVGRFCGLIGASEPMQSVYDLIEQVAPTESTVMVLGETGTGKEVVANCVHALSKRSRKPFVPLNCGAVSPTLIESELFGHEKGAFTGADRLHRGVFERADGGTLFLDELPEMPLELQVKLLRVIESGQLMRLGGDRPVDVDVRIISATNRDTQKALAEGAMREDLLYRLLVFPIELPPLRERGDDIELLASYFVSEQNRATGKNKRISEAALAALRRAPWPGNVRELKHTLERAFILAGDQISADDLPLTKAAQPGLHAPTAAESSGVGVEVGMSIAQAEKRLILATLDSVGENKKRAAEILGISVKTLYNRLREYNAS